MRKWLPLHCTAGSTTREALKESSAAQGRLAKESMARIEALATAVSTGASTSTYMYYTNIHVSRMQYLLALWVGRNGLGAWQRTNTLVC